jgi:hypothetical protein
MVAKSNIQRILVILMVLMVSSSLHTYAQGDTPPPSSEITFTLKDNVDSLRVRSGAGTGFAVLGILDASNIETFVIDPQKYDPNSDWIEGTFGETQTGFIYADYTDVTLNTPTGTSLNPLQRAATWNNPTPTGESDSQQGIEVAMADVPAVPLDIPGDGLVTYESLQNYPTDFAFRGVLMNEGVREAVTIDWSRAAKIKGTDRSVVPYGVHYVFPNIDPALNRFPDERFVFVVAMMVDIRQNGSNITATAVFPNEATGRLAAFNILVTTPSVTTQPV